MLGVAVYTCVRNSPSFAYKVRIIENELQGHLAVLWTCGVRTGWGTLEVLPSVPFLNALIEEDSKVIVVSEHWLWPFELHRLQEVHPEFSGTGKADAQLVEDANLCRGCGGVGIL